MDSEKASSRTKYLPVGNNAATGVYPGWKSTRRRYVEDGWMLVANAVVVGVIVYFLLVMLSNFTVAQQ
jgi:hypothetical protein